ncbi:GDSL-type esterase/lipase family protein [Streptomyces albipurpureus]|uniref:GDSL-type esterase/lipase family protein n=1 Tax=Streptomyces albipurpureus TaxID=2897419 RepID=A0ABT0UY40_9ACTN|nr:GDSL-type esterase/lipase family protein [Streptomyces sp. CWNU-1]MCM2393484.1 GDSL-type esterase/lipase family protein [Streptomyces sp. CWNU-1]
MTWLDPNPFLRGVAWLDQGRPVRADPVDMGRLPWHTGVRAALPIGVRLEFTAKGADAVDIHYRTPLHDTPDGPSGLPDCFALWQNDELVSETLVEPTAEGVATLVLPRTRAASSERFIVHPPESRSPVVLGLRAVGGSVTPAANQPRWLVHGDSITEGWWSTRPAHSWPARAGRLLGLDTVNLGYAGSAHGEPAIAEQLSTLPADALTLAFGTNCWSEVPYSPAQMYETVRTFLAVVRQGHPRTPLLVVSPVLRPAAEDAPNRLGATLAELRTALERAVLDRIDGGPVRRTGSDGSVAGPMVARQVHGAGQPAGQGDAWLALLPGRDVLVPQQLTDGVHPDDEGHAAIAAAVVDALRSLGPQGIGAR